ncbi:MAG: Tm-1-like ATP-binding domain-containing protein, partial [Candidatus Omnitrophota bacterium]
VVPGCMDFIWGHPDQTDRFKNRKTYRFNRSVWLGKLKGNEISKAGQLMAKWINKSPENITVILPLGGLSKYDKEGEEFYDPELDRTLFKVLKRSLDPKVRVVEADSHINEHEFARVCVVNLISLLSRKKNQSLNTTF